MHVDDVRYQGGPELEGIEVRHSGNLLHSDAFWRGVSLLGKPEKFLQVYALYDSNSHGIPLAVN